MIEEEIQAGEAFKELVLGEGNVELYSICDLNIDYAKAIRGWMVQR